MKFSELIHQQERLKDEQSLLDNIKSFVTYDDREESINVRRLYTLMNNQIPNVIMIQSIHLKNAMSWFEETCQHFICETYTYDKVYLHSSFEDIFEVLHVLDNNTLVYFSESGSSSVKLYYAPENKNFVENLANQLKLFENEEIIGSNIYLLVNSRRGLETEPLSITNPNLNIADNYNDDFLQIHELIDNRLNQPHGKGLVLLHGIPGTGKTTYIRHLITSANKKVIFLPPNMAASMTNPELLSVLIENPNSILVVEDAEKILINREQNEASPVSALLNLTDGLLSDCLNIQVICSFNTDLSKLDRALLRKGRLIAKYEFKPLEISKAQQLASKLGMAITIDQPMALTDIYNHQDFDCKVEARTTVGFK